MCSMHGDVIAWIVIKRQLLNAHANDASRSSLQDLYGRAKNRSPVYDLIAETLSCLNLLLLRFCPAQ